MRGDRCEHLISDMHFPLCQRLTLDTLERVWQIRVSLAARMVPHFRKRVFAPVDFSRLVAAIV